MLEGHALYGPSAERALALRLISLISLGRASCGLESSGSKCHPITLEVGLHNKGWSETLTNHFNTARIHANQNRYKCDFGGLKVDPKVILGVPWLHNGCHEIRRCDQDSIFNKFWLVGGILQTHIFSTWHQKVQTWVQKKVAGHV